MAICGTMETLPTQGARDTHSGHIVMPWIPFLPKDTHSGLIVFPLKLPTQGHSQWSHCISMETLPTQGARDTHSGHMWYHGNLSQTWCKEHSQWPHCVAIETLATLCRHRNVAHTWDTHSGYIVLPWRPCWFFIIHSMLPYSPGQVTKLSLVLDGPPRKDVERFCL